MQWREDVESEQDVVSCVIPFADILEVTLVDAPPNSFQIVASGPRTVVFQYRPEHERAKEEEDEAEVDAERAIASAKSTCVGAEQWCEYLDVFSQYARQQQSSNQRHSPTCKDVDFACAKETKGATDSGPRAVPTARDERTFTRLTRAIIHQDVAALDALFAADPRTAQRIVDESGSSLLVVALKLGAGPRVVQTLINAGVDCNATNDECVHMLVGSCVGLSLYLVADWRCCRHFMRAENSDESPLLLVAASGDSDLLATLLRADGIAVNQPCSLGATAFHAAANAGDVQVRCCRSTCWLLSGCAQPLVLTH